MSDETLKVNLNQYARMKLSSLGRKILQEHWAPYGGMPRPIGDDGVYREQLWEIMRALGPHIGNGLPPVFESTEIEIEP